MPSLAAWQAEQADMRKEQHQRYADKVAKKVKKLNERIKELERCLEAESNMNHTLQGELGVLGELMHQRNSKIEDLETENAELKKDVAFYKGDITALDEARYRIEDLEEIINELQG